MKLIKEEKKAFIGFGISFLFVCLMWLYAGLELYFFAMLFGVLGAVTAMVLGMYLFTIALPIRLKLIDEGKR